MINGLGVLGWGVGGIEAEAAMLGEPISMPCRRSSAWAMGVLPEGATATDLVLTVTEILRAAGVVGKFVEYFGHGLATLPLADRATICSHVARVRRDVFFPVDDETLQRPRLTGRPRSASPSSSMQIARRTRSGTTRTSRRPTAGDRFLGPSTVEPFVPASPARTGCR